MANSELSAIVSKIAEFSERAVKKISEQNVNSARGLIAEYVNFLTALEVEEAKNILAESQNNILHIAAKFGDITQIARILEFVKSNTATSVAFSRVGDNRDVNYYVNLRDNSFLTPLHYAARNGWPELIVFLLENGADSNPKSAPRDREWMPIHYAAKRGYLEVVKILLLNRVDKEVKTSFGLTPLLVAAEFGHLELVRFLLSNGANKDAKTVADNHHMNALHYAAVGGFADVTLALINAGVDKEVVTSSGLTALHFAVGAGYSDVINVLLKNGVNTNVKTNSGHDILYFAALKGKKESVIMLLQWGVGDLDAAFKIVKDSFGKEAAEEIKSYQKAIKDLFALKNLPANFDEMLRSFTKENLSEARVILEDGVSFNAYGIMNLRKEVGIFHKENISLAQVAHNKKNEQLFDDLAILEKTVGLYKI